MQFFCPVCQKTVDVAPESTITTKMNQVAHKAHCPVCKCDLAAYEGTHVPTVTPNP